MSIGPFPFYIRGIQRSSCTSPEERPYHPSTAALFDISAADYDDIVSNHPEARLSYVDDDDIDEGEQIMVRLGSWQASFRALELTNIRLDPLSNSPNASRMV